MRQKVHRITSGDRYVAASRLRKADFPASEETARSARKKAELDGSTARRGPLPSRPKEDIINWTFFFLLLFYSSLIIFSNWPVSHRFNSNSRPVHLCNGSPSGFTASRVRNMCYSVGTAMRTRHAGPGPVITKRFTTLGACCRSAR